MKGGKIGHWSNAKVEHGNGWDIHVIQDAGRKTLSSPYGSQTATSSNPLAANFRSR